MKPRIITLVGKNDQDLAETSKKFMLALNLEEMKKVQKHFEELGRNPTDAELETIAQTWSEHCVHKTFSGIIRKDGKEIDHLLRTYIIKATTELNMPWCRCVFEDNAGIVKFDDDFDIAVKAETHNHPTALDPYGGAGTGSGGVFRDVMGVGAKPILSTDVLFFGPPDYPHDKLPEGVLHPKRLMKGSVAGIRDYGNRMGIPTANGGIGFDEGYIGNPLVYAGVVGIMPNNKYVRNPKPGDMIVLVGGKTGRDGIHGVTFASLELTTDSEKTSSGAVQIGNAIEEKRVLDGQLIARDRHDIPLYSAITDCGGGGLSSAVGEMGKRIGVRVELDKVPLKYPDLEPWEIWISEAQERMILAVPKGNVKEVLDIFRNENTDATVIGEFTGDKKLTLIHEGDVVAELDMGFLHKGVPRVMREARFEKAIETDPGFTERNEYNEDLKRILSSPNVASKEWVIRQYDHEVQAKMIIKPVQGYSGPGDACVIKPRNDSWKGIVVSNGVNPKFCSDPYNMALSSIDEAMRNNLCCGGRRIALLDNFSWGNPEKPDRLGALVESVKACHDGSLGFQAPFISGKDSLYNEYSLGGNDTISIPYTLLVTAVGIIPDIRKAVTMDLKREGNPVYMIGKTKKEMGGSHFYMVNGLDGGKVPGVNLARAKGSMDSLVSAMDSGIVRACHDCSEGGMAVTAAEMTFAGNLGMRINLKNVDSESDEDYVILFSESNSRFLVEVKKGEEKEFEEIMGDHTRRIGEVTIDKKLVITGTNGNEVISEDAEELKRAWKMTFDW
ncbi:MAG: phosphoribosylformylglycinamidine synthase subunit PurL [Candidatus Aenigmarchaeota archaeon]|nr:phosphoribosylformylglycinamidine synthase subunit PurL [Candidatus Aenigmarchaeota archaeon]